MAGGGEEREFQSLAGLWKLACAMAVLVGHNLVTLTQLRPQDGLLAGVYHAIQFFSPLHFLFFSGYLAMGGLASTNRPMIPFMAARALRIYVLVVLALAWGLLARWGVKELAGTPSLGSVWPLGVWDGPIDLWQVLRHLNPFGFADHMQYNYAVWYLYQELRIVLLFPLFRWILGWKSARNRWAAAAFLMVLSAGLEYRFWPCFPLFRSSPFQSLSYGVYFLAGALVRLDLGQGGVLRRVGRPAALAAIAAGLVVAYLEAFGIRPNVNSPAVLMVQTLVGQILIVAGVGAAFGNFRVGSSWRRACDWSVGIYIAHPPIHMLAAWFAIHLGAWWPFPVGIAVSVVLGIAFHVLVERPSQTLTKGLVGIRR